MQINRCGRHIGRVEFTFAVCAACYQEKRRDSAALFGVSVPPELITAPHVLEWIHVHDALTEPLREKGGRHEQDRD